MNTIPTTNIIVKPVFITLFILITRVNELKIF